MRFLHAIVRHIFSKWTIGTAGAIIVALAGFYKYQFEMRPLVEMTAPDPVEVQLKDEIFKFDLSFRFRNAGRSTALGVKTYHVFFTYPPDFKDLAETDIPDIPASRDQEFTVIKYLDFETVSASTNFFGYQNLIVVTTWRSDNVSHFRTVFSQAQWYRVYLHMQKDRCFGSYLTLVKSRYYSSWNMWGEEAYRKILGQFLEGETLMSAYNLKELEWSR